MSGLGKAFGVAPMKSKGKPKLVAAAKAKATKAPVKGKKADKKEKA